mgnify:CR=1 FL=1
MCSQLEPSGNMIAGAISGLALDLHRGTLPVAAIDAATSALLVQLGLDEHTAEQLGHAPSVVGGPRLAGGDGACAPSDRVVRPGKRFRLDRRGVVRQPLDHPTQCDTCLSGSGPERHGAGDVAFITR